MLEKTFENMGKRLAADMAPGYEADYSRVTDKTKLKISVSQDSKDVSSSIDFIEKIFEGSENKADVVAKYRDITSTDAQAWTSLEFFIDTLYAFGNKYITTNQYNELKGAIKKSNNNFDIELSDEQLKLLKGLIMNPIKPVYANNNQQKLPKTTDTIGVRSYIKISAFPLIKQLVVGTELEDVAREMSKNRIDMHVFSSGFKVGSPQLTLNENDNVIENKQLSIFSDGKIDKESLKLLNSNAVEVDLAGFKIQQDVPYHDEPGEVNLGTQESKLLFSNINDIKGFSYKGRKNITGKQLEEEYYKLYHNIYKQQLAKLKSELYVDNNGNPTPKVNIEKLHKILEDEAISRNYSINDVIGLQLNDTKSGFRFPLWALPAAHKYESLIISIVDNRVRKVKFPGNSFVLGSEAGFSFKKVIRDDEASFKDAMQKYQSQIIFTSNFDHEHGKLKSFREDPNDKIKILPSQVFVPCKFKMKNGKFINLMDYTKEAVFTDEEGKKVTRLIIDNDRLPKELLNIFGFRIPTQGHNSMAAIEIAGFLPVECGDLIIASKDFTVQMGSDKR